MSEPLNFKQACRSSHNHDWTKVMEREMTSLLKNQTWSLFDKCKNMKVIDCKRVFKRKLT